MVGLRYRLGLKLTKQPIKIEAYVGNRFSVPIIFMSNLNLLRFLQKSQFQAVEVFLLNQRIDRPIDWQIDC